MHHVKDTGIQEQLEQCREKIMKAESMLEALPQEFIKDWRERKAFHEKRKQLEMEIIQARSSMRSVLNTFGNVYS
jgi:chromosome segregation ATPase